MNASAKRCRCGHEFDPATAIQTTTVRCPLCGSVVDGGAAACNCGYDFSTKPQDVRFQLVRRKRYGWFWIASGLVVVVATGGVWFVGLPLVGGVLLAASGAGLIARGIRAISWTRGELADLDARDKALPEARVVKRD